MAPGRLARVRVRGRGLVDGTNSIELQQLGKKLGIKGKLLVMPDDTPIWGLGAPGPIGLPEPSQKAAIRAIVNLQHHNEPGTHWVGVYIHPGSKTCYVMDSLGFPPDQPIVDWAQKRGYKVIYSQHKLQDKKSSYCGEYATAFIAAMDLGLGAPGPSSSKAISYDQRYNNFLSQFGPDTVANDKLIDSLTS